MPLVKGKPISCGDCNGTDPTCRCCQYGCHPETGQAYLSWAESRLLPSTYTLGWGTHRWSGWPGAYCMLCGIDDPTEYAVATDEYETWFYLQPSCPFCPYNGAVI